ncbi:hypothetical protein [Salinispora vitiensis]|nr:hypothetical protein [Salinispora vitiensis]
MLWLRSALREYFPAALAAFADLTALEALEFLARVPGPASAALDADLAAVKRARRRHARVRVEAIRNALNRLAMLLGSGQRAGAGGASVGGAADDHRGGGFAGDLREYSVTAFDGPVRVRPGAEAAGSVCRSSTNSTGAAWPYSNDWGCDMGMCGPDEIHPELIRPDVRLHASWLAAYAE